MRRAILHIGTEKTGTQTLQRFLAANRPALAARGVHYARFPGDRAHRALAAFAQDDGVRDELRIDLRIANLQDLAAFRARLRKAAATELARTDAPAVIFSSEHLSSRLIAPSEIARLRDFLAAFFDRVQIAVYLRRQDRVAVSLYSTLLKFGIDWWDILPDPDDRPHYWDYAGLLARWAEGFGQAAVTPRIFEPAELVGGTITRDFAATWGLGEGLAPVPNLNEAMAAPAQELLRRLNTHYPGYLGDRPNRWRGELGQRMAELFPGAGVKPSRAEAEAFAQRFADGNETVRQIWFPDRPTLFSADFSTYPEHPDPRRYSFDQAVDLVVGLWGKGQARELGLRGALARARGWIAELEGRSAAARLAYAEALTHDPDDAQARAAHAALSAEDGPVTARWPVSRYLVAEGARVLFLAAEGVAEPWRLAAAAALAGAAAGADAAGGEIRRGLIRRLADLETAAAQQALDAPGWFRPGLVADPARRLAETYLAVFVADQGESAAARELVALACGGPGLAHLDPENRSAGLTFADCVDTVLAAPPAQLDPVWRAQSDSLGACPVSELYAVEDLARLAEDLGRHLGRPLALPTAATSAAPGNDRAVRLEEGASRCPPQALRSRGPLSLEALLEGDLAGRIRARRALDTTLHAAALRLGDAQLRGAAGAGKRGGWRGRMLAGLGRLRPR